MRIVCFKIIWGVALLGVSVVATAGEGNPRPPQEPAGFITGAVIGAFAAGPAGAIIGAGIGTWLGNRVHRAGEASRAEAEVATLRDDVARDEATDDAAAQVLNGLQGDVLFRTGSAEISPDMTRSVAVLAQAVAGCHALKVRVDGYADPRGTAEANLTLSQARANAVRDVFVAAGVAGDALQVSAHGKSQSTAGDADGYALERRVRLTLQAKGAAAVAENR